MRVSIKPKSIRTKLVLAFAFAVCPILLIYGWTQGQAYVAAQHLASSHQLHDASLLATRFGFFVQRLTAAHQKCADEIAGEKTSIGQMSTMLRWLDHGIGSGAQSTLVTDQSVPSDLRPGRDEEPVVSDFNGNAAYFEVSSRLRTPDGTPMRLTTRIPTTQLIQWSLQAAQEIGWSACLVLDSTGRAVVVRGSSQKPRDGFSLVHLVQRSRATRTGNGLVQRVDRYVVASKDLPGTHWRVVVLQDSEAVYAAFRGQHRWYEAAFLLSAVGLVVLMLVGNRLSHRIKRLAHAASALAVGDYRRRIQMDTGDELTVLADAFNSLGDSLAQHEEEMRRHADLIGNLADAARASSSSLELRQCASEIAAAMCANFSARDAAVFRKRQDGEMRMLGWHGRRSRSDWRLVASHACQSGEYLLMSEKTDVPDQPGVREEALLAGIPLAGATGTIGAIVARFDASFKRDDLRPGSARGDVMRTFGIHAAAAIANAEVHSETERVSETLRDSVQRLASVVQLTDAIAPSLNLEDTLTALANTTATLMDIDGCAIFLPDGAGWLVVRGVSGQRHIVPIGTRIAQGRSVSGKAYVQCKSVACQDAARSREAIVRRFSEVSGMRSVLSSPLVAEGESIGVISVYGKLPRQFSPAEIELLESIGQHASFSVRNAGLYTRESAIAEALQGSLMPQVPDDCPGLCFASRYIPMLDEARLGGDFFDVTPLPNGTVAVLMADVSGKGLKAAMHLAACKYMFKALLHADPEDPGAVLDKLNSAMNYYFQLSFFVTMFYAIIDPRSRLITYASAGHLPALLISEGGKMQSALPAAGMPVGAGQNCSYRANSISARNGDVLLLYTDGVTDVARDGAYLGVDGLRDLIFEAEDFSAPAIVDHVCSRVQDQPGIVRRDDIALLAIGFQEEIVGRSGVSGGEYVGRHSI